MEALAILGGGAAATQLLHYGLVLLSTTSALSRQIRHAPDKIQSWIDQCSTMRCLLDSFCDDNSNPNLGTSHLLQQCRSIVATMRLHLRPFRVRSQTKRPSKRQEIIFVIRKEDEIERLVESFRHKFDTLALGLIMLSVRSYNAGHTHNGSLISPLHMNNIDDPSLISARSNLGIELFHQGRLDEAEHIHRYAYTARCRLLGDRHHETIKSKANIAMAINEKGQHGDAEAMYREVLMLFESVLGHSHPDTLKTYTNLATTLHDQGRYEQAADAIDMALPTLKSTYGISHEEFLAALEFRAILLQCLQMYAAALRVAKKVYKQRLVLHGYEHDDTRRALCHVRDLAEDYEEEKIMKAFPLLIEAATN